MSPDPHVKCSLRQSSDAHSSALAHAVSEQKAEKPGEQSQLRLAVFGEGLVAAQSSNALALGLCEAFSVSDLAGEAFVALYSGVSLATLRTTSGVIRDVRGRSGPNLEELTKLAQPNLILIVAGGHDLTMHRSSMEVATDLWDLLQWTRAKAPETLVAAMAIPDGGRYSEQSSMLGPLLTQRCRDANGHLASWCCDEISWIGTSSLPCGPRSIAAGYWDGPLLSPKGAKVLAGRLICKLLPRLMRHQRIREENAKGLPLDYSLDDGGEIPSLDAFLKAFSLEDEAEAKTGCSEGAPLAPPWEVAAAVVLQRQLRSLFGSKGKAQRLALARLRVRQLLAKTSASQSVRAR
eukprot:symbB.v1.2.033614.t1/scaffold4203.1/size69029/1